MSEQQLIITLDPVTGVVRVQAPDSKLVSDYLLCEARRILDRLDDHAAAGASNGRIVRPEFRLPPLGKDG